MQCFFSWSWSKLLGQGCLHTFDCDAHEHLRGFIIGYNVTATPLISIIVHGTLTVTERELVGLPAPTEDSFGAQVFHFDGVCNLPLIHSVVTVHSGFPFRPFENKSTAIQRFCQATCPTLNRDRFSSVLKLESFPAHLQHFPHQPNDKLGQEGIEDSYLGINYLFALCSASNNLSPCAGT